MPIRILVVDDHKIVADAISTLLDTSDDLTVVDRVYSADRVPKAIETHQPDIVLCDLEMPLGDPLEACHEALSVSPSTKIVVLTAFPTDAHVLRAISLHVSGFITKHEPAETVVDGIRAIAAGHEVYSDEVRERMISSEKNKIRETKILRLSPERSPLSALLLKGSQLVRSRRSSFDLPRPSTTRSRRRSRKRDATIV